MSTPIRPAQIHPDGASTNDVLTFNGTKWTHSASAGGAPSGAAGGDLTGTYPNPRVSFAAIEKWANT